MRAIILNARAENFANRPRRGFRWIRRAHRLSPPSDRILRFERHHHNFSRAHELREVLEKRPLAMHCVKSLRLRLRQPQRFNRRNLELRLLNVLQNVARQPTAHRVRLDNR